MKKYILLFVYILYASSNINAEIFINEIMQSNIDCIMDDINEFPDSWVELYNNGVDPVNVGNYRIGLKSNFDEAYKLPKKTIPANGHLIIYCDKVGKGLHANFRIDSGKGSLYLFSPQGDVIDQLKSISKQPAPNIAYGREADGAEIWGYQITPTPGLSNSGGISDVILPEPIFSKAGAVFDTDMSFELELSVPEGLHQEAQIIYTLTGEEPSLTVGQAYTHPIIIDKTTVVRAKIIAENAICRPSTTNSYIFSEGN